MISTTQIPETVPELKKLIENQNFRIRQLEELVRYLRGEKFGRSSEKLTEAQLSLFKLQNEITLAQEELREEIINAENKPSQTPSSEKGGRRALPESIERVRVEHDLPQAEKKCACGCEMKRIGEETSEKLHIIPMQVQVIQEVQFKYACPQCSEGVHMASKPEPLLPKINATEDFLAHVAVSKFEDALPLYRMCKILHRYGIEISRATLANWMIALGEKVQPLVNLIQDHILEYDYLGIDETPFQVLKEKDRKADTLSYMWILKGGPPEKKSVLFKYDPHKSQKVLKEIIEGFKGYLQSDGGSCYSYLESVETIHHVGCFAHARRYFAKIIKHHPSPNTVATEAVDKIGKLYQIESEIRDLSVEEKYRIRQEQSLPLLNNMKHWLDEIIVKIPSQSLTGKALNYMGTQWKKLIRYTEDGRLNIDNNPVEQAIRPFVVGRKNWLFSDTPDGAHANANLYSLIESAKANGREPYDYLRWLFKKLPSAQKLEDFEALLPWNF